MNRAYKTHRVALTAWLACLIAAGCDPWSSPPTGPSTPTPTPTPTTTPTITPTPTPTASIEAYSQCYGGCYRAHTNATNRETCKLDCDGLAEMAIGADADLTARTTYEHLRGCIIDCWENRSLNETNRSTCLLTCAEDAEIEATPVPRRTLEVVPGTVLAPDASLPPGVRPPSPTAVQ